jgi:hypothetical protein
MTGTRLVGRKDVREVRPSDPSSEVQPEAESSPPSANGALEGDKAPRVRMNSVTAGYTATEGAVAVLGVYGARGASNPLLSMAVQQMPDLAPAPGSKQAGQP